MSEEKQEGLDAAADAAASADVAAEAAAPEAPTAESAGADKPSKKKEPMTTTRRAVIIGVASTAVLLGLGALRYVGHTPLKRPPGGQDEAHLVDACIRCEKCYEACPRKIIYPARIEDGLLGMRSPALDFSSNWCDFCVEENGGIPLCVKTCPTGALALPDGANAYSNVIGLAVIDQKTCLAYRDTGCHFCYDACAETGYDAIELDGTGYSSRPYVINDKCVGCGACESVCVSLSEGSIVAGATERAIVVRPLSAL